MAAVRRRPPTAASRNSRQQRRATTKGRDRKPTPPGQGWHLPPHLIVDTVLIAAFAVVTLLVVISLPLMAMQTGFLLPLHRAFAAVLGATAALILIPMLLLVVGLARWLRFGGPVPQWMRFVGGGLLIADWLTLLDVADSGEGGMVGKGLRRTMVELLGPAAWLIWIAAALVGAVWVFHVSLPQLWRALAATVRMSSSGVTTAARFGGAAISSIRTKTVAAPSLSLPQAAEPLVLASQEPSIPQAQPVLPIIKFSASQQPPVPKTGDGAATEPPRRRPVPQVLTTGSVVWQLPTPALLRYGRSVETSNETMRERSRLIERTLAEYGVAARVQEIRQGPRVTQFGVRPDPGIKVARILGLQNDLAMALEAKSVRIEAPVPGKPYVGIEVPNPVSTPVAMRGLMESAEFQSYRQKGARLPIVVGCDVAGEPIFGDLTRMPHLLIAGATGSGKSVCINALITCLLLQFTPDELQLLLVDPKQVELTGYNVIPHLKVPVIVDVSKVVGALDWCVNEMERRYSLLAEGSFRDIHRFNEHARHHQERTLPYIVVVIDELADLMMQAADQVEIQICRLAQKARAIGIHLVVATQRPSVDVITGLIKANFPSRIAFAVSSGVDSRTILDSPGAERLLGMGDMLYTPSDALHAIRVQGTHVSDEEIEDVLSFWEQQREALGERWQSLTEQRALLESWAPPPEEDPESRLFEEAVAVLRRVVETAEAQGREASVTVSLLQRRLRIGQTRALLLMDELVDQGLVGSALGPSKSRSVNRDALGDLATAASEASDMPPSVPS